MQPTLNPQITLSDGATIINTIGVTGMNCSLNMNLTTTAGAINLTSAFDINTVSDGATVMDANGNSITIGNGGADNLILNATDSIDLNGSQSIALNCATGDILVNAGGNVVLNNTTGTKATFAGALGGTKLNTVQVTAAKTAEFQGAVSTLNLNLGAGSINTFLNNGPVVGHGNAGALTFGAGTVLNIGRGVVATAANI